MITRTRKRWWAGVAALAVASIAPLFNAPSAFAAGTLSGAAAIKTAGGAASLQSGNGDTNFTLRLPSGASCPGDSPTDGYRWQTYVVPASVDPSTLQFGSAGPTPAGVGATYRQPLFTPTGSPIVNQQTAAASPSPGPGPIINIPDANFQVFAPGDIPAGVYNLGIACTLGPASTTQMKSFWNVQMTVSSNTVNGGNAQIHWENGTVPAAPTLNTVTPNDAQLTAAFTPATSNPAATSFVVTATPTSPAGAPVTATGASSPITVTGLTNGTTYSVTVHAHNSVGDSPESNALSTTVNPGVRNPVTNLTATPGAPGSGTVDLSWVAPSDFTPTGYNVTWSPNTAGSSAAGTGTARTISGLTPGTSYTFTVTPTYPAPYTAQSATAMATPTSGQILVNDVTVTRPAGAIVLTQVCGVHAAIPADTLGTAGFPAGSPQAAAVGASTTGTGPTGTAGGTDTDPRYAEGQYPYPQNADGTPNPTYPTHCGIDLGSAKFIRTGPGAGQFFSTGGVLNQVTIADTRDTDVGWTVNGLMSDFQVPGNASKKFSGSQLGWTPNAPIVTAGWDDAVHNHYQQTVDLGPKVDPNTANGLGLGSALGHGQAVVDHGANAGGGHDFTGGLGIARLDARLKLLIPVTAKSGVYTGTLTITVTG